MTVRVGIALAPNGAARPRAAMCYTSKNADGVCQVHFLAMRDLELAVSDVRDLAQRTLGANQAVILRTDYAGPFVHVAGVSLEEIRHTGKRARKAVKRGLVNGRIIAAHPLSQADLDAKVSGGGVLLQALTLAAMN